MKNSSTHHRIGLAPTYLLTVALLLIVVLMSPVQAQTFKVIYNFTNGADGAGPEAGLIIDNAGNLYGTTPGSSNSHCGTVFKMSPSGSSWAFSTLYTLNVNDGCIPRAKLLIGPTGNLIGTAEQGGKYCNDGTGCGTVFSVALSSGKWTGTPLYQFTGSIDGAHPFSEVVSEPNGNLYGTASQRGIPGSCAFQSGCGVVYHLKPVGNGKYTFSVTYSFKGGEDGGNPEGGLLLDDYGDFFGTTTFGGDLSCNAPYGCGTVFHLTYSGSKWIEKTIHAFEPLSGGGGFPTDSLIWALDGSGNLYGTVPGGGGPYGGAKAFKVQYASGAYKVLYSFGEETGISSLVRDKAGNLYGTTTNGGAYGFGSVYKLTRSGSGWVYSSLHDFTGQEDGGIPYGSLVVDANGNLYGTGHEGGSEYFGVVFEITP